MITELSKRKKITIMTGVVLAMLLAALDQTILATAMPKIVSEFNGLSHLSWVFTAYMLASTVIVPIYGKLSDIYGRRWFYIGGILLFLIGSALSGASQSMIQLIIFRAIQGLGGGAMMVNSIAIIGDIFPPAERGKWQGLIGGVFGLASVAGPLLGGWLTDNASWRWNFYINIPLGLIAIGVLATALPKIKSDIKDRVIDYAGAILLTAGLVPLLLGLVWGGNEYAWNSATTIGLFAGALIALISFFFVERKAKDPILPLSLFKNRVFSVSVAATFLSAMGMFGAILYIPLFAQGIIGVSATNSGLILTPLMIGLIFSSAITGQIMSRTGKYKWLAILGMAIVTAGMYLFSRMTPETSNTQLIFNMVVTGIGLGTTFPIFNLVVQSAFDHSKLGVVTAANQLFRSIGGTVGIAVLGSVLNNRLSDKLGDLSNQPFVQSLQRLNPQAALAQIDLNQLQGFLQPAGQEQIRNMIAQAPAAAAVQLNDLFISFLQNLQIGYSNAITHVFFIAALLMGAAFVIVWFLPEITLRKSNQPALVEAGMELEAGLGQSDAEHEPDLTPVQPNEVNKSARRGIVAIALSALLVGAAGGGAVGYMAGKNTADDPSNAEEKTNDIGSDDTTVLYLQPQDNPIVTNPNAGSAQPSQPVLGNQTPPQEHEAPNPVQQPRMPATKNYANNNMQFTMEVPSDWMIQSGKDGVVIKTPQGGRYLIQMYSGSGNDIHALKAFLEQQPKLSNVRDTQVAGIQALMFDSDDYYRSGYALLRNDKLYYILSRSGSPDSVASRLNFS